ncbi:MULTISPECIES: TIGR04024 family LLM class F420-dependent oxidoreductase [unclassified Haladaptatus]|uniref:TIGR04024 family LLM class F420-dependent oxidoreductase n=1 Tax=unclassified Haladaptatus TaxID=2622732 RepID=UPI0023E79D1C|nr:MULTISPECIES: TIGR04024 family LLM class F420-dependent oxidoreductase [unclassified Haladaptatus]
MTDVAYDVFLPVAAQPSVSSLVSYTQRAEELGYDRAWLPETWGRDAVTTLATIAHETEEIGIGTSIMPIYSRSPTLIGQTAATLQEVSDDRFRLGLGPSGPIVIEGWHGQSFERPLRYTRETIEIVKLVLAGEQVDYDGDIFNLGGFRLRCDPPETPPPVDAAGMGPKSVELAGRFADGWHALMMTEEGLKDRLEDLRKGAELAGKDPDDLRVSVSLGCCVLDDAEYARELARQHLAFYIGGMGTFYRDAVARQGWEDVATTVSTEWANRNKDAAMDAIPDELLDQLSASGSLEQARDTLDRFASIDGVDAINVSFPRAASAEEIEQTLEALAPDA